MTAERAAEILGKIEGEFRYKKKFAREQEEDVWVVEDGFTPIRQGTTRGRQILEIKPQTEPGALNAIDKLYYANAYPVIAVVYSLYPIRESQEGNLRPMRDGDLNCVAKRVIEHFDGAKRDDGLTFAMRWKIADWEAKVHEEGATLKDVSGLEKILKQSIIVRDIAGADLYNSGKYQNSRWRPVELTLHNGHAWGADLRFARDFYLER